MKEKSKKFDCVTMKGDIREQIRKDFAGVPEAEAHERQMRQVAEDPILGPLYQRLASRRESASRS